jgi:hypothetical protein
LLRLLLFVFRENERRQQQQHQAAWVPPPLLPTTRKPDRLGRFVFQAHMKAPDLPCSLLPKPTLSPLESEDRDFRIPVLF